MNASVLHRLICFLKPLQLVPSSKLQIHLEPVRHGGRGEHVAEGGEAVVVADGLVVEARVWHRDLVVLLQAVDQLQKIIN